jgi:hypothetical protein
MLLFMNKFFWKLFPFYFSWFMVFFTGCAYRQGTPDRTMPGGYRWVRVPIFKNYTQEPGIEVFFTNAMIDEIQRSRVAHVVEDSDVFVQGNIEEVNYRMGGKRTSSDFPLLPEGAVQATEYRILILARISVIRGSDQKVLWTGQFNGERTYTAPQIASAVVNTANPLYNLSARRLNIKEVANDIASEAFDRMTENF